MSQREQRKNKRIHPRQLAGLPMRQRLHIFCEGMTEVGYFTAFRTKARYIPGGNALAKVREAIIQMERMTRTADQYWIVLDKDETPDADFDQAITLAEANQIHVAWSNQAFELWIIHHFRELSHACHRTNYAKILREYLPEYQPAEKEKTGPLVLYPNKPPNRPCPPKCKKVQR